MEKLIYLTNELLSKFPDRVLAEKLLRDYHIGQEEMIELGGDDADGSDQFWALLILLCEIPGVQSAIFDVIPDTFTYDDSRYAACPSPNDYVSAFVLEMLNEMRKIRKIER